MEVIEEHSLSWSLWPLWAWLLAGLVTGPPGQASLALNIVRSQSSVSRPVPASSSAPVRCWCNIGYLISLKLLKFPLKYSPKSGSESQKDGEITHWIALEPLRNFFKYLFDPATFRQNSQNKSLPRRLMLRNCDLCQMLEGGRGWGSLGSNHFISFHVVKLLEMLLGPPFQQENTSKNNSPPGSHHTPTAVHSSLHWLPKFYSPLRNFKI